MFRPIFRQSVFKASLLGLGLVGSLALPVGAHQVKVAGDIGGTLHIEPNDTARAGEPTNLWFAIARSGGSPIALSECRCRLALYSQPYQEGDEPLAKPALVPVTAEGYTNTPGTQVVFPAVGAYTLVLEGSPQETGGFEPFTLPFEVTVAAAATPPTAAQQSPTGADPSAQSTEVLGVESETLPPAAAPFWQPSVIAASLALIAGLLWSLRHRHRDDDSEPPLKP
ncbi:MAG TPA: hypothetical protein V6D06_20505 [Trichocoleus sp.]